MIFCSRCGAAWDEPPQQCHCGYAMRYTTTESGGPTAIRTTADGGTLFLLYLKTWFFSLITLGIYGFWGRAEIRRYLYGETWVGNDRLANHTTGGELIRGWLKALVVVMVVSIATSLIPFLGGPGGPDSPFWVLVFWGVALLLLPYAIVGSARYRLSRTVFRGVHFSSTAETGAFALIFYKGLALTLLTLGIAYPFMLNEAVGYLTRNTRYGDRHFGYDAPAGPLFRDFLVFVLLLIPTLGLSALWFRARQHRHLWNGTSFEGARFVSSARGREMVLLGVTNLLLVVFTLGIGYAWAQVRYIRYLCDNLVLVGDARLDAVLQRAMAASATGEGLATILDVDADVGDGFAL